MSNIFYYQHPPPRVMERKSSQVGKRTNRYPKDQYYDYGKSVAMPIYRGREPFFNNMRHELTGNTTNEQIVKPLKSNNFFKIMEKSKKQEKPLSPKFKLTDYCSPKKNKGCNILYIHYVVTNKNRVDDLISNPSRNNINKYVKYLLKVRDDTKKVLGVDNQDLLVSLFLEKLLFNNAAVFFSVIDSNLIQELKGGSRTRTRTRTRTRKQSRKNRRPKRTMKNRSSLKKLSRHKK